MSQMWQRSTSEKIIELNKLYKNTNSVINHDIMKSQEFRNIVLQVAVASIDASSGIEKLLKVHEEMLVMVDEHLTELGATPTPNLKGLQ
jgi:hypothetical protein